jgi:hypothetical protein
MHPRRFAAGLALVLAALAVSVSPAHAQGKGKDKHYAVTTDRAARHPHRARAAHFIVRIERVGVTQVVLPRRNQGRGKGRARSEDGHPHHGPPNRSRTRPGDHVDIDGTSSSGQSSSTVHA